MEHWADLQKTSPGRFQVQAKDSEDALKKAGTSVSHAVDSF